MGNPIIRIHNVETSEIEDREMTDAEFAEFEQNQISAKEDLQRAQEAKRIRESALAKLAALGLTEDEIAAL